MTNSETAFRSPKGIIAHGEGCVGIVRRPAGTFVHLRIDESNEICAHCLRPAMFWMDSKDRWSRHPARCEGLPRDPTAAYLHKATAE